jgi:hypothetical protein
MGLKSHRRGTLIAEDLPSDWVNTTPNADAYPTACPLRWTTTPTDRIARHDAAGGVVTRALAQG